MIDLAGLREYMRRQLQEDRRNRSVKVSGSSVEEALRQASVELDVAVRKLAYEVLEPGAKGLLGGGGRRWTLLVYPAGQEEKRPAEEAEDAGAGAGEAETADRRGEVFVRLTHEGVFLKATPPVGRGGKASERQALEQLARRGVRDYDAALVSQVIRHADGEYIKVGEYDYNPANQSVVSVEIAEQEMAAYATVLRPGPGGPDLTYEEIIAALNARGVVYGIQEDVVRQMVDYPRYNEPIRVAEGKRPVMGKNAQIVYSFNTDHSRVELKEKNGRVDFKELDLVQNVEAGQVLARKIPPDDGETGTSVTGKTLPTKPGKDTPMSVGKNVTLSEDGQTAIAAINGQVLLVAGKINVEPVYTVEGDVNLHTGNILFLGTVIVKGNVEDGFSVKAAGNIEVLGSVGKCVLDAEGDIIVHQGIMGKGQGQTTAGMNVIAKFIEHARVCAESNVVVSDGIIHSFVDANHSILCQGRRAAIVGGRVRAAHEVNAKSLGSVAGTETILEVGFDPRSKERVMELSTAKAELEKQIAETELNIRAINNLRKVQREISEEKLRDLKELAAKRAEMLTRLAAVNQELGALNSHLSTLKTKGKVSASDRVFPGVKIFIRNESLVIRSEFKRVTFYLQGKEIRMTKYEPIEEETARRP